AVERVGFDDVGAGLEVLVMDRGDRIGPREDQEIVVAAQILRVPREPLAAEIRFRQPEALDHRPHCAVKDENALREERVELCTDVSVHPSPSARNHETTKKSV